ncbi:unnamed protein product [Phaedon cochleariae]|uniref:Uncharacterized protein n=1 Tax=Phaedon cochleariae TaxID=80249 RepID=A0A9P0GNH0_PHACE|nr:unnamed protein product [Phaedon cochleariae]
MDISQMNNIYEELKALQEEFKCCICNKRCQDPVRVKVCGHYFCHQCLYLKKGLYSCPECNMYYEDRDTETNNIVRTTHNILADLEVCLKNIIDNNHSRSHFTIIDIENHSDGETRVVDKINIPEYNIDTPEGDILAHNNKKYKIIFIEGLEKVNAKGETPLHIACKKKKQKNREFIELLEKGVDINAQDFAGWTPLVNDFYCLYYIVRLIPRIIYDYTYIPYISNWVWMHEAVESGNMENIEYLLNHGALINTPGEDYTTPLHKAAVSQNIDIIKLLLEHGADQELIDLHGKKPVECTMDEDIQKIFINPPSCLERVEHLFCNKKIVPFCYYIENEYENKLKQLNIKIQNTYDKKVTHFILRRTHKLSLKILIALLDGCTIVPQEWIDQFLKNDHFIPIPHYSIIFNKKLNEGIQKALIFKLLKLPKLFDQLNFYIYGHKSVILLYNVKFNKDSLGNLIKSGGGKLLHRAPTPGTCDSVVKYPFHARNTTASKCCNYIIFDENSPPELRYQMPEIKHRSSKWLVNCIISYTLLDSPNVV